MTIFVLRHTHAVPNIFSKVLGVIFLKTYSSKFYKCLAVIIISLTTSAVENKIIMLVHRAEIEKSRINEKAINIFGFKPAKGLAKYVSKLLATPT